MFDILHISHVHAMTPSQQARSWSVWGFVPTNAICMPLKVSEKNNYCLYTPYRSKFTVTSRGFPTKAGLLVEGLGEGRNLKAYSYVAMVGHLDSYSLIWIFSPDNLNFN